MTAMYIPPKNPQQQRILMYVHCVKVFVRVLAHRAVLKRCGCSTDERKSRNASPCILENVNNCKDHTCISRNERKPDHIRMNCRFVPIYKMMYIITTGQAKIGVLRGRAMSLNQGRVSTM